MDMGVFGATAGVTANQLVTVIAGICAVLYLTWTGWVAYGQYKAWAEEDITLLDLFWTIMRAAIVVMVVGFYVRPGGP